MRSLLSLTAAAFLAGTAAHAVTITDPSATVSLWSGDIYAEALAPVSPDLALTYATVNGGLTFTPSFALSLENGTDQLLFAQTDSWSFDGDKVLSFLFDLEDGSSFGDWISVTFTFADSITDPFGLNTDISSGAAMSIASGTDVPAVPVPATLPLLLGALAAGSAFLRRRA